MKTCRYREDFTFPQTKLHFHLYSTDYPELHNHDYWEFFIVLSGECEHYTEKRKQLLTTGMGCLVHPRDKHRFTSVSKNYKQMKRPPTSWGITQLKMINVLNNTKLISFFHLFFFRVVHNITITVHIIMNK